MNNSVEPPASILNEVWPADGLETCKACPVCGGEPRELMHSGLADRIFFVAPGEWTMWKCLQCGSGYLDPRPSPATIHQAYAKYYTHEEENEPTASSALSRLRVALGNDYRNARFNARLSFAIPFAGRLAAKLLPGARTHIEIEYRCLPPVGANSRLLDVGSANGGFLRKARDLGWDACGVEVDPVARQLSDKDGFDVRTTLADWADQAGTFEHATASHVIEHVHHPGDLLNGIRSVLGPGGSLYIQTPNIDAPTHFAFGGNWRGLEPPRHLVVFSRIGLEQLLLANRFRITRWISDRTVSGFLTQQSKRIAEGRDPYSGVPVVSPPPTPAHRPSDRDRQAGDEFLTVVAEAI